MSQVRKYTEAQGELGVYRQTDIDGLMVVQNRKKTTITGTLYHPVLCLILQGAKEVTVGSRRIECIGDSSVIVSHTLPIQSRITSASATEPYLAMILQLDLATLRDLVDGVPPAMQSQVGTTSIAVDKVSQPLLEAMHRLYSLNTDPSARHVLAPLILREIHYRLLMAPHGNMLRQLLSRTSHASRIAQAIAQMRDDYNQPLSIPELSSHANMSPSSFHQHFKTITGTSPIQYQKDLRLLEAQRLLFEEERSVTEAAIDVGYQSPAQFSRDYSRKFGIPPNQDRHRMRNASQPSGDHGQMAV